MIPCTALALIQTHTLSQPTSKIKPSCLPSQRILNGISFCLSKSVWTSHTDVPVSFLFHVGDFFPCSFPPSSIDSVTLTSASPNLHSSLHLHPYDQRKKVLTGKSLAESCWNHHRRERRGKRRWTWKADSARVPNLCVQVNRHNYNQNNTSGEKLITSHQTGRHIWSF